MQAKYSLIFALLAGLLTAGAAHAQASATEKPLGHVSLPRGKYVLTNTETGTSSVVRIDEHGMLFGPAATTNATTASPAAPAATTATPAAAGAAAGTAAGTTTSKLADKLKREATRAVTSGQAQKLMKKVGAEKYVDKILK